MLKLGWKIVKQTLSSTVMLNRINLLKWVLASHSISTQIKYDLSLNRAVYKNQKPHVRYNN